MILGDDGILPYSAINGRLRTIVTFPGPFDGNDRVTSGAGDDVVIGGGAWDWILAGVGNDLVFGDHGNVTATRAIGGRYGISTEMLPVDMFITRHPFRWRSVYEYAGDGGGDDVLFGAAGDDIVIGGPWRRPHLTRRPGGEVPSKRTHGAAFVGASHRSRSAGLAGDAGRRVRERGEALGVDLAAASLAAAVGARRDRIKGRLGRLEHLASLFDELAHRVPILLVRAGVGGGAPGNSASSWVSRVGRGRCRVGSEARRVVGMALRRGWTSTWHTPRSVVIHGP